MPTTCCVYGCKSRGSYATIKYFAFPTDKSRREEWINAIRRENFNPTSRSMVCNLHFTSENFEKRPDMLKLTAKAIPTIFNYPENPRHKPKQKKVLQGSTVKSPCRRNRTHFVYSTDHMYTSKVPKASTTNYISPETTYIPNEEIKAITFNCVNSNDAKSVDTVESIVTDSHLHSPQSKKRKENGKMETSTKTGLKRKIKVLQQTIRRKDVKIKSLEAAQAKLYLELKQALFYNCGK